MIENRSKYTDQVEFDIECSKVHRTSVRRPGGRRAKKETAAQEDAGSACSSGDENGDEEEDERGLDEEVLKANREAIEVQNRHPVWGRVFQEDNDRLYEIREKIGEGGEAKIYAGVRTYIPEGDGRRHIVFKVCGRGTYLQDLIKLWPEAAFMESRSLGFFPSTFVEHVMLLPDDGRIALVMARQWGDLRRLIDLKKQANHNQGPPFDLQPILILMSGIAFQMSHLHYGNVVHRDLKASNVLLRASGDHPFTLGSNLADVELSLPNVGVDTAMVSDFECALGVLGTGFWRAPEVLLGLRDPGKRRSPTLFTKKSDVYSYGIVCYEIATGSLPFEREGFIGTKAEQDLVINGQRPAFPGGVDCRVKDLISRCWHGNENRRPTFDDIQKEFCWNHGIRFRE